MNKEFIDNLIDAVESDIIQGDGGYYALCLEGGLVSSEELKIIAEYIELLNNPYHKQITEYFENE